MTSLFERIPPAPGAAAHEGSERSIGRMLLDAGKIRPEDAERALHLHKEQGLRFGEACVTLGLVTEADIQQALASQFSYPYLRPGQGDLDPELVAAYEPFSAQVEALRALRTQLLLRWFNDKRKVLPIVSPSPLDGRSYLAANLAIVFSQLGEETLLIDADMRQPRQHRTFRLSNQYGLSAVLSGRAKTDSADRIPHFSKLWVLPAGAVPPNPVELIGQPEFAHLIDRLARDFDVILIDTPAAESGADALAVAAHSGGALLLGREDHTRLKSMQALATGVQGANAEVVGGVLKCF